MNELFSFLRDLKDADKALELLHAGYPLDPLFRDRHGVSVLFYAVQYGNLPLVKLLVEKGCDVNEQLSNLYTPLMYAVRNNRIEVVKFLLENGADMEIADKEGWTPLIIAAVSRYFPIMRLLIEKGANIHHRSLCNYTTFLHALIEGATLEDVQYLVAKGAAVNDTTVRSVLMEAVKRNELQIVRYLIEQGADVNAKTSADYSVLEEAARFAGREIVELLLTHGACVENRGISQMTPLMYAAACNNHEAAACLLAHGADPELRDAIDKFTSLHFACYFLSPDTAKLLIDRGVDMHILDKKGRTPLINCAKAGGLEIVKYLVEHGVDISYQNRKGKTVLDIVKNKEVKEYLMQVVASGSAN